MRLTKLLVAALVLNATSVHGYCVHSCNLKLLADVQAIIEFGGTFTPEQLPLAIQVLSELNVETPEVVTMPVCYNDNLTGECT